jgi:feruloyl esterase
VRHTLPWLPGFAGLAAAFGIASVAHASEATCAAMAGQIMPQVHISSAVMVPAQSSWSPDSQTPPFAVRSPFCRVQGVIETEIGFELWLPEPQAWNGKFLGTGVGGDAGVFNYRDTPRGVARGYAAGATDSGHKAADRTWMLGHPQRLIDYELRSHHLLASTAKPLVATYYAKPAEHAYFIGCSGGGRQGLKEMQKFPDDYDGIVSGAGGPKAPEMTVRRMWELLLRDARPGLMSPADWKLVADAGVRDCDGLDGVIDGVAEDPRRCRFDVASLLCKPGAATACLSAEQVAFVRRFYEPLRDGHGRAVDLGLLPGVLVDSGHSRLAPATFGQAVRGQADWKGEGFNVGSDLAAIDRVMPELRADQTDLHAFKARGGKAILYQGWMDPAVAALMMVDYYQGVERRIGGSANTRDFLRLFMVPGMLHCAGGAGPDQFGGSGADAPLTDGDHDLLSALEDWVEHGRPPERIIAAKVEAGRVARTRPLCSYPAQARYTGAGSTDEAANFRCFSGDHVVSNKNH